MLGLGSACTDFDFDAPGKRRGFIDVSFSDNENAFSSIRVPVGIVAGGSGPTVLLTAGNHGDEYEGQAILHQLMHQLNPQDVTGRMIMLPALNTPAVQARTRVSPLDGGNMNRSFPGDPRGGPTAGIAAFVSTHLIPMADVVLDFHSGGTATEYVDCAFLGVGPDAELNAANLELAETFGALFTMLSSIDGTGGDFDTAAHCRRTRFLACELGGLGRFSPNSFATGWQGTRRVLDALGVLQGKSPAPATRFIDVSSKGGFATAAHHGLAKLHVSLTQDVGKGDLLATVFDTHNFGQILAEIPSEEDGVVAIVRRNPMVRPGDHICKVMREIPRDKVLS
ncbi:MAG: succinylglutamate desuccinylase/aspartoacylase family protein [Roseovarius sp.]|nr:succinylglutamate desuccinylase/aspartoacylase family protein [Roseovarius sp.]